MLLHLLLDFSIAIHLRDLILDLFQTAQEEMGIALLLDELGDLFNFLQQILEQGPDPFKVLDIESVIDLDSDLLDEVPLLVLLGPDDALLVVTAVVVHEVLSPPERTYW